MTETEHRFLKAIAERVAPERVAEVRLFPAIKQGHMQSAVAVVAAAVVDETVESPAPAPAPAPAAAAVNTAGTLAAESNDAPPSVERPDTPLEASRFSVLTARYRLTLKGPERGKWEFEMLHDADAPLDAVERVVHGVVRRAGDAGEPQLLSAAEFRRAVGEAWWAEDGGC